VGEELKCLGTALWTAATRVEWAGAADCHEEAATAGAVGRCGLSPFPGGTVTPRLATMSRRSASIPD
jgi:hypothetical protein